MNRRKNGYIVWDAVGALAIVSLLASVLAVSANRQQRASQRLDDQRIATAAAERAIEELHTGKPLPDGAARSPAAASSAAPAPAGYEWTEVTVKAQSGRTARIVALVPKGGAQ